MYKKILVPLDGTVVEREVLQHASALARNSNAELVLMRVLPGAAPDPLFSTPWVQSVSEGQAESLRVIARSGLERTADKLRCARFHVTTHVYIGRPVDAILECAQAVKADAIVMSSLGLKTNEPWLDGDVTAQVLKNAHMPVFLVGGGNHTPDNPESSDYSALA